MESGPAKSLPQHITAAVNYRALHSRKVIRPLRLSRLLAAAFRSPAATARFRTTALGYSFPACHFDATPPQNPARSAPNSPPRAFLVRGEDPRPSPVAKIHCGAPNVSSRLRSPSGLYPSGLWLGAIQRCKACFLRCPVSLLLPKGGSMMTTTAAPRSGVRSTSHSASPFHEPLGTCLMLQQGRVSGQ